MLSLWWRALDPAAHCASQPLVQGTPCMLTGLIVLQAACHRYARSP